ELADIAAVLAEPDELALGHGVAEDLVGDHGEAGFLQLLLGLRDAQAGQPWHRDHLAGFDLARRLLELRLRLVLEVLLHRGLPDLLTGVATAGTLEVLAVAELEALQAVAPEALLALDERLLLLVDRDHRDPGGLRGVAGEPDRLVAVDGAGL